ncbi:hypothetical protein D3C86_2032940 [compost metagenome]
MANGDGPGVGLLLLIAGRLVDREIALVLHARTVDVGVIDDGRLGKGRCTAKHGDNQQRAIHLNGPPLRLSEHPGLAGRLN